jgi:hypothetical protein
MKLSSARLIITNVGEVSHSEHFYSALRLSFRSDSTQRNTVILNGAFCAK